MGIVKLPLAERVAILKRGDTWFARAPTEFQDVLMSRCEWRIAEAGVPVIRSVERDAPIVGLVEGAAEVYTGFNTGDKPLLHFSHEGTWFGAASVVTDEPAQMTVVPRVDCIIARLPAPTMREILASRPEWWKPFAVAGFYYGHLAICSYYDSVIRDNERRFACTLLRITGLRHYHRARPELADAPVTQSELAEMNNVSRTTVIDLLRRLEERRIVEQGYRYLRVLDRPALERIADGKPSDV